jgi:hypothetical protein
MKQIVLIITIASFWLSSCSQDIPAAKVPSVVQNTLQAKFSNAGKIEWEKKNNEYEAEFHLDSIEYTVLIDGSGKIVMYKQDIKENELPAVVAGAISQAYAGYKIDDAEKLEKDGVVYYQVELEAKSKKDMQLVFTTDGKIAEQITYMK